MNQIEIYQTKDKQTQVEVSFQEETVWLTQKQITTLWQRPDCYYQTYQKYI
jgi:hypothetical protein